jgi:hypothetical protein
MALVISAPLLACSERRSRGNGEFVCQHLPNPPKLVDVGVRGRVSHQRGSRRCSVSRPIPTSPPRARPIPIRSCRPAVPTLPAPPPRASDPLPPCTLGRRQPVRGPARPVRAAAASSRPRVGPRAAWPATTARLSRWGSAAARDVVPSGPAPSVIWCHRPSKVTASSVHSSASMACSTPSSARGDPRPARLRAMGYPSVVVGRPDDASIPHVDAANRDGGYQVGRAFVRRGMTASHSLASPRRLRLTIA